MISWSGEHLIENHGLQTFQYSSFTLVGKKKRLHRTQPKPGKRTFLTIHGGPDEKFKSSYLVYFHALTPKPFSFDNAPLLIIALRAANFLFHLFASDGNRHGH